LSLYTPAYRRPQALLKCLASVAAQTCIADIEQVVFPDHIGYGVVDGLFGRMPWYAHVMRGQYVFVLADDDVFAATDVVAKLRTFAEAHDQPPVIVVKAQKNEKCYPLNGWGSKPERKRVDLSNYVLRRDIWLKHIGDYGMNRAGDFEHALALWPLYPFAHLDLLFVRGAASKGAAEVAA
jgi:hypothetical protein